MSNLRPLELWGGVECTVNRVGDRYFDQLRQSGHHDRPADIDRFASLGIRAIRYPLLWERIAPTDPARRNWAWTDERLERLKAKRIRPIATLLHHGSGPAYTDLLSSSFVEEFAAFAAAVARRYPWIADFTPINEPLTTARFSALYGHWYPHARDDRLFVRALLNQIRGVVRAMERIAEITPHARLIATEDAGRVTSTPRLAYQAEFENHRRWLTLDLLCGHVDEGHPLWGWLRGCGASTAELHWLGEHAMPPSIVGLNYYLTSDRHLDERIGRCPSASSDGNGRDRYVDVDAVRVPEADPPDHGRPLQETWERYRVPLALTEVHAGCTREEQMRWLARAWEASESARRRGVEVVAVTTWALLGSYNWNTLVTRDDGEYEPGAFDARSDPPRLTAVGRMARTLAQNERVEPLAEQPGWWQREGVGVCGAETAGGRPPHPPRASRPLLIAGSDSRIGAALVRACGSRGLPAVGLTHRELDAGDRSAVARALFRVQPWAVVNAVSGPPGTAQVLASASAAFHITFLSFSTADVFDGRATRPYVESDAPAPRSAHGEAQRQAEASIAEACPAALIVRTTALFDASDPDDDLTRLLRSVSAGHVVAAASDLFTSPTYVPHVVDRALDLFIDREQGIWHLANEGVVSWAGFASLAVRAAGLDDRLVHETPSSALPLVGPPPHCSALSSARGRIMPTLERAVGEYLAAGDAWRERRQAL